MKDLLLRLGARIKELRKMRGFTQEAHAEQVAISPQYLSRLEVGLQSPSIETLAKLAKALNVDLSELCDSSHQGTVKDLHNTLRSLIREADEQKLRLVVKVVRAMVR
jgi:transcriptional regulator with XRE-family HTH domain